MPEAIRAAIMAAAPGAVEIGDRAEAIREAVAMLQAGDTLIVAGKGHETGQIVGQTVVPFSDHECEVTHCARPWSARHAVCNRSPRNFADVVTALGLDDGRARAGAPNDADGAPITGISIDTRSLQPGDLFFAIKTARRP